MKKGIDYPGVTIGFFCHDGKGNFLMNKRSENCRDEKGKWDIGSGGLDLGETVEGTLKKEIKEEYSTDLLDFEFLGYRDVHRIDGEYKTHWIDLDFKVLVDAEKVENGEPHKFDAVEWFTMENHPDFSETHSQFENFLNQYQDKLI
jgi:8-oxo-dGTP diphosphatase